MKQRVDIVISFYVDEGNEIDNNDYAAGVANEIKDIVRYEENSVVLYDVIQTK